MFPVDQSPRLGRYKLFAPVKQTRQSVGCGGVPRAFQKARFGRYLVQAVQHLGASVSTGGPGGSTLWEWVDPMVVLKDWGNEPANPLTVTTTQVTSEAKSSQYVSPRSFLKVDHEGCPGTYPEP